MPNATPEEDLNTPVDAEEQTTEGNVPEEPSAEVATESATEESTVTDTEEPSSELSPELDAAAIIAENQGLLSQLQSMLPDASGQPQASENASALEGDGAVEFGFDKSVVDNMVENPEAFAAHVAQTIYARIMQDASPMVNQAFQDLSAQQQHLMGVRDNFYQENPELVGHENIVGAVATQLAQQFPHITEDQLLLLTANFVKKRFGNASVQEKPLGKETVTPLQTSGNAGTVQSKPQLSEDEADLQDLLEFAQNQNLSL